MKKFYIKSLGCKTNQLEGQIIKENLIKAGFIEVQDKKEADIYILNSCTVTSHAEAQALYLLGQIKKLNPKIKTVLTGCMAQTADKSAFFGIDLILGNEEKLKIENYMQNESQILADNIFKNKTFTNNFLHHTTSTRPSVKIQDGCNNRCSYCLIPYARGNSRSNSVSNVIEQIKIHTSNNKKEIVLTGIHIGQWGQDIGCKLVDLLKEIEKTDIKRYRLGSLYVNELDFELFDFLVHSKKFCPHFHLSLQSMCDKTLKNMNRFYTKNEAISVIQKIHENFDLPFIGCDIITGFPLESEDDFIETKEALIQANVSYIHSFPYSKRKGTKAAAMEGQILEHVKKERTKELISVCNVLHKNFLEKNKTKTREILFEKKGKNGLYSGVTDNYIKVYKKSDTNLQNTLVMANLADFEELY